jgi:hypothetical protein
MTTTNFNPMLASIFFFTVLLINFSLIDRSIISPPC